MHREGYKGKRGVKKGQRCKQKGQQGVLFVASYDMKLTLPSKAYFMVYFILTKYIALDYASLIYFYMYGDIP